MKKFFTLIAAVAMTIAANAQTEATTYNDFSKFDAENVVIDNYGKMATTDYEADAAIPCISYTGTSASEQKMNVTFKNMPLLTLNYGNSKAKDGFIFYSPSYKALVTNGKGVVIILGTEGNTLKAGDKVTVKFCAKGGTDAVMHAETNVTGDDVTATGGEEGIDKAKVATFVVTENGTCKIKETSGGFQLYEISITAATAINEVSANAAQAPAVVKTVNGIIKDGKKYNFAGQQVK